MEVRRVGCAAGIHAVKGSVRIAQNGIRTVKQELEESLTAASPGPEEDAGEAQLKAGLSASEWKRYKKLPEWIKRRLRTRAGGTDRAREAVYDEQLWQWEAAVKNRSGTSGTGRTPAHPASRGSGGTGSAAAGTAAKKGGESLGKSASGAAASGAAKAGTAASGAATAGATAGVTAAKEAYDAAKRNAGRIKEALTASMEAEKQTNSLRIKEQIKEAAGERMKERQEPVAGNPSGQGGGFLVVLLSLFCFALLLLVSVPIFFSGLLDLPGRSGGGERIAEVARQELEQWEANVGGYKYKEWYGMDADWCAMFVSWCADQCGYVEDHIMPKTASVTTMKSWYERRQLFQSKESGYTPCAGDVVFFGNGMSHTGLVVEYDPDTKILTTIEGNTGSSGTTPYHKGSRVMMKRYPLSYDHIIGYGTPEYPELEEAGTEEASEGSVEGEDAA